MPVAGPLMGSCRGGPGGPAEPYPSIAAYALLSDRHSAALVSRDGSVDWYCSDRFAARPVQQAAEHGARGGHVRLAPDRPYRATRRYLRQTNVLETRFETADGALVLTDCLAVRDTSEPVEAEGVDHYRQLIRRCAPLGRSPTLWPRSCDGRAPASAAPARPPKAL
jgi:hypothetical protein